MLLLGALFLATAAIGIALSAVFYGIVARVEADDLGPSHGRSEWQASNAGEAIAHADHSYRAAVRQRMAVLAD